MVEDSYIIGRLIIPIIMIVILGVMIYCHRRNALKYLYIVNIALYGTAIVSDFILTNRPIGAGGTGVVALVWVIAIFVAYFFSMVSLAAFFIEQSQRHLWAKIVIIIAVVASAVGMIITICWIVLVGMAITSTF